MKDVPAISEDLTLPRASSTAETLQQLSAASRVQMRRLSEARAREHVGAAGWRQTTLLEEIILAGRSQFSSTDALRQVVSLTTESLRALPLSAGQETRDHQQRTLEGVLESGHQQVEAAHELEGVIGQALREIVDTPLPDLNVRRLERVLERVQEQIRSLDLMIEAARAQVGTLEQLQALDNLSESYQRRLGELHALSAAEELEMLGNMGEEVARRVTQLDVPGDRQLETLGHIGEAAVKQVAATDASREEQLQTLDALQDHAEQEAERLRATVGD
jgi:hypothetical protein